MAAAGAPAARQDPLALSRPSPTFVLQYPLLAASVRLLCEQEGLQAGKAKQSSLTATLAALRLSYRTEGLAGLYRGAPLYALHQATRELLRFLADRGLRLCGAGAPPEGKGQGEGEGAGEGVGGGPARRARRLRLAAKYAVDAACYPLLLASTRAVLLGDAAPWQRLRAWCGAEGPLSLFGGLAASLACTALEEAADALLDGCLDRCDLGSEVGSLDRLTLKACSSQVVSVFTAPFNCLGVIQRCQSRLEGLPPPRPLWSTVLGLPWTSSLYQLLAFGGVLALNVKMIRMKLEFESYEIGEGRGEEEE